MASIYALKPVFQNLLRPVVGSLAGNGITANQVTVTALLLSAVGGLLLFVFPDRAWVWFLVPGILLIRMALNALDGMLAREHNMQSRLGCILNELGDVVSDTLLYLPFVLYPGVSKAAVVLIVVFAVVSEMTGVVAVQIGASRRYDGPMGKSDRAFLFAALGLCFGLGWDADPWVNLVLWLALAALIVTIFRRAANALRETPG